MSGCDFFWVMPIVFSPFIWGWRGQQSVAGNWRRKIAEVRETIERKRREEEREGARRKQKKNEKGG